MTDTSDGKLAEILAPCPFCGSAAEWCKGERGDGSPWDYIACEECEAMGGAVGINGTKAEAIAAWNRRAASPGSGRVTVAMVLAALDAYYGYDSSKDGGMRKALEAALALTPSSGSGGVTEEPTGFEWTDDMYAAFNAVQAQKSHPRFPELLAVWKAIRAAATPRALTQRADTRGDVVTAADQIVREEWHAAVKRHNLRPGSPTEATISAILERIRALAAEGGGE